MRWWVGPLFVASQGFAQVSMPIGIVRGDVVAWTGTTRGGELKIRNPENTIYGCLYDGRTYFERDHQMIGVVGLAAGDPVEVVADRKPGTTSCYARTVHVVDTHAQKLLPGARPKLRASHSPTESFAPRGDMAFGGVVSRCGPWTLTLKTRNGEETVLLRPDTRYLGGGVRVDPAALRVNTHVFVRAGRNIEGDVEAYQVIWGDIVPGR